jgi:hypothetical protein
MTKPATIEEAIKALTEILSKEQQADILKMSKDDLALLHHGLGQWIRNNWDLWKGGPLKEHMISLGFIHPDDMSGSLIREFWNRLNNKVSELEEDIQYYKEFWKKNGSQ